MARESAILIALPKSFSGATAQLSVLVVPRLEPDGDEGRLDSFAFAAWPRRLADATFEVRTGTANVAATRTGDLHAAAWDALFPPDILVRRPETSTLPAVFGSYPAARIHDSLRQLAIAAVPVTRPGLLSPDAPEQQIMDSVASLGAGSPQELLAADLLRPVEELSVESVAQRLANLAREQSRDGRARGEDRFTPIVADAGRLGDAWAQFAMFHQQSALARVVPRAATTPPRLDFAQRLALLAEYPELQRRLGLLLDLTFDASALAASPDGQIEVHFARQPHPSFVPRRQPATRYRFAAGRFEAAARGDEIAGGLLRLSRPDSHRRDFELIGFDLDSAGLQVVDGLRAPGQTGRRRPAMYSSGLSLVHSNRAERLLAGSSGLLATMNKFEAGEAAILFAEDLIRGYRIDIFEARTGKWRSLHQRTGTYTFTRSGETLGLTDEGAVVPALTQPARSDDSVSAFSHDPDEPAFATESIFLWTGWSLSATRPGRAMEELEPPAQGPERALVPLTVKFDPTPNSLPRLRFGGGYRVRLRVTDLAGNSLHAPQDTDAPEPQPKGTALPAGDAMCRFLRCEPIGPPVLQREGDPHASSIEVLVLRAGAESTAAINDDAGSIADPPGIPQLMAERLGMFDASIGGGKDVERTFRMARGEAGGGDERVHRAIARTRDALPDPMATGIAVHNCPGIPAGQRGAFDSDRRLQLSPLNVPEALRSGVASALLIPFHAAPSWPAIDGIELRLRGGSRPPEWNPGERTLTMFLPPGAEQDIGIACTLDDAGLDKLAVLDWAREILDGKAKAGLMTSDAAREETAALRSAAKLGMVELAAPARRVRLIHAVRQPLRAPNPAEMDAPVRLAGGTRAFLGGEAPFDPSTTARMELHASWKDREDRGDKAPFVDRAACVLAIDVAAPAEDQPAGVVVEAPGGKVRLVRHPLPSMDREIDAKITEARGALGRLRMALGPSSGGIDDEIHALLVAAAREPRHMHWANLATVSRAVAFVAGRFAFDPDDPGAPGEPHGTSPMSPLDRAASAAREAAEDLAKKIEEAIAAVGVQTPHQDFGDPRHRTVTYQWRAVSRFSALYPPMDPEPPTRFATAGAPMVISVPSSMRPAPPKVAAILPFFEWKRSTADTGIRSHQRLSGLRVYLDRPWFSTGDGELLGVIVGDGFPPPPSIQKGPITRWARDPIWITGPLPADPKEEHFRDFAVRRNDVQSPDPENFPVIALGYEPQFDSEGRCFADVALEAPDSYFPFVRFALARLQPDAIRGFELSEIVFADPAALPPVRTVTAIPTDDGLLVSVIGTTHTGISAVDGSRGTLFRAFFQHRIPGSTDDAGWQPVVFAGTIRVETGLPSGTLWKATVRVTSPEPDLRLLVQETETIQSPDGVPGDRVARIVFAEALAL